MNYAGMRGSMVIVRTRDAGVHAGRLVDVEGEVVALSGARRLWRWQSRTGVSLSGVAVHGLGDSSDQHIEAPVPQILIRGWCEIMPCSEASAASISAAPERT